MLEHEENGYIDSGIKSIRLMREAEPKMFWKYCTFVIIHGLSWTIQVVATQLFLILLRVFTMEE